MIFACAPCKARHFEGQVGAVAHATPHQPHDDSVANVDEIADRFESVRIPGVTDCRHRLHGGLSSQLRPRLRPILRVSHDHVGIAVPPDTHIPGVPRLNRRLARPRCSPATSPAQYPAGSGVGVSVLLRQAHGFEGLVVGRIADASVWSGHPPGDDQRQRCIGIHPAGAAGGRHVADATSTVSPRSRNSVASSLKSQTACHSSQNGACPKLPDRRPPRPLRAERSPGPIRSPGASFLQRRRSRRHSTLRVRA